MYCIGSARRPSVCRTATTIAYNSNITHHRSWCDVGLLKYTEMTAYDACIRTPRATAVVVVGIKTLRLPGKNIQNALTDQNVFYCNRSESVQ